MTIQNIQSWTSNKRCLSIQIIPYYCLKKLILRISSEMN